MKYVAFLIGIVAVFAGYFGYQYTQSTEMAVGAPFSQFISTQLASSPVAGYVLSTDGAVNSWIPAAGGGSSKWTDAGSVIYPTGGESIEVTSIAATGTATSTFTNLAVSTGLNLFGTIGTALSDFCVAITGGAGLCDGNDATGGGSGGGLSTTTPWTNGNLAYVTGLGTVGSVATGTLTESVNGLQFDNTRALIGGSAVLSLSAGFAIPSTTDYTGWNLASSSRHAAVTLSGALDYITLVGQDIVRGAIDLATDITGFLGITNGGTGTSTAPTTDQILVGRADGGYNYRRITAGSNVTISTSTAGQIQISATAGGGSSATSTMIVCASGCTYSSIQDAINAGFTNIELKAETYAGPVSITASDTKIKGAGLYSSLITCAATASTACVKIATSTNLTRITLEHFGIDNTLGTTLGIGLDTSNTSNVYVTNVRVTEFNQGHLHQDTNNQSFYSSFNNMVYFDNNNCFATAGTKSNDNTISNARCRVATTTGFGYKFVDAEGWLLNSVNSEPGSVIGTGLYIDGTSISNTIINPWFEGNATGTEIVSGAINTSIKGGRITAGTIGISDAGIRTFLDSTLVSANTTDFTAGSTGITMINGRSTFSAPSILVGTTTPSSVYERLVLGLSTSEATANALTINNYGAFATAPAAILFNNTTGGFNPGVARIFANPGSGYTNANLNFAVSDSAKALQTRMTIDVDGDVGIGTTTPNQDLTVVGGGQFTSLSSCDTIDTDVNGILTCGTDATGGGGGGGLSTTSPWTNGNLAYVTGLGTVGSVATGTLTTTATGTQLSATRGLVGGSAIFSWSPGYDAVLNASSSNWNSFYNTPSTRITAGANCSWAGNTFNCEGGGGGGGGGALSTTTDVIGAPATPELVSYVTGDVMFGGSASTSAEFQFDDDAGQFIISSTSNTNATATIESSNAAQAVRIGDDSGVGMENIFSTVATMITRFYGAIVSWIIDIPAVAMTGKLFVTSSSTAYYNATTTDSLVIDGPTNSGEWIQEFCTTPTGETTAVVADTLRGCNRYSYLEDAAGQLNFVVPTTGTSTYFNIQPGTAGAANALGDGMGIGWASGLNFGDIQKNSPAMEFAIRQSQMANATSTFIQAGLTSAIGVSADFAAEPAQGFYVFSSSTVANYLLACNPSTGATTYVDTGIASSTVTTADANPFVHFRLEVSGTVNTSVTAILKARTTTDRNMLDKASCTLNLSASTQAVAPTVAIGKSTAGTSSDLHLMFLKFWYKQPVF